MGLLLLKKEYSGKNPVSRSDRRKWENIFSGRVDSTTPSSPNHTFFDFIENLEKYNVKVGTHPECTKHVDIFLFSIVV
jgi:hypothetical protein